MMTLAGHSRRTVRFCLAIIVIALHVWTRFAFGDPATSDVPADMDRAIALLNASRLKFKTVRDYECRLVKQERVKGTLLPEGTMSMKVRSKPFSVYLLCETPDDDKGLAVCYVEGKHGGKMRVRPSGIRGILDFWSVDTHDPRAFQKNRHCITEIGIGNLLESTSRYWEMERRLNQTVVEIRDETVGDNVCTRIETIHPQRDADRFYGYRCVLWLDKATQLPIGAETYDWPREGGPKGGDLLESYRYLNLRTNVGLSEGTFRH